MSETGIAQQESCRDCYHWRALGRNLSPETEFQFLGVEEIKGSATPFPAANGR
jgi:hypothetical protein